jgi:hypothetical protein
MALIVGNTKTIGYLSAYEVLGKKYKTENGVIVVEAAKEEAAQVAAPPTEEAKKPTAEPEKK